MIATLSNYQGLHCVTESLGGRDTEEGQSEEQGQGQGEDQEGQGEGEALLMHVRTAEDKVKDIKYIKSLSARAVARKSAAIKVHGHNCVFIVDCAVQQHSALFISSIHICSALFVATSYYTARISTPAHSSTCSSVRTHVRAHTSARTCVRSYIYPCACVCIGERVCRPQRAEEENSSAHRRGQGS